MLQRTLLFSLLSVCCLSCILWYLFLHVTKGDIDACYLLETRKKELSKSAHLRTTQQNRVGVLKEIYLMQDEGRFHYKIQSVSSFLTLVPRNGRFDLYEKLENMDCWLQDKLYYEPTSHKPMQQIKHLKAKEGTYRYTTHEFVAASVDISLYRLPGHTLSSPKMPPFMHGVAESVSFAVTGKNPEFHAHRFTALLGGAQGD